MSIIAPAGILQTPDTITPSPIAPAANPQNPDTVTPTSPVSPAATTATQTGQRPINQNGTSGTLINTTS